MKKYIPILLVAGLLGGCNLISSPNNTRQNTQASPRYTLAASHWGDVAKIRNEATRLGYEVNKGRMTKTQAAQQLNTGDHGAARSKHIIDHHHPYP